MATGPAGTVTLGEVLTSLRETVPAEAQASVTQSDERLGQVATSVYRNKWLAERARSAKLEVKEPEGAAPSEVTRTRFWAEQYMQHQVRQAMPDDATLTKLARTSMKANPANFRWPADKRVRHILLNARQGPDAEVEARAQTLLKQLEDGADFAALAKTQSQDAPSAVLGGELGWLEGKSYVPEFLAAVASLQQPGQRSPVFRTEFGYHIVELEEVRVERAATEAEATEVMRHQVFERRNQEVRARLWQQAGESVRLNDDNLQRVAAAARS
ncbi:peptidylprolyl isomerase [Comamonas serinivorans]|uniref:peptidylprolyl isomerase n=1 Tax=Comamonas serinivorans TaxID=1082851 RepID=UPI00146CD9CF|nr:peptidylprolyl isomerase [Comamonas serinivorans]